jgi:hypothetical protein
MSSNKHTLRSDLTHSSRSGKRKVPPASVQPKDRKRFNQARRHDSDNDEDQDDSIADGNFKPGDDDDDDDEEEAEFEGNPDNSVGPLKHKTSKLFDDGEDEPQAFPRTSVPAPAPSMAFDNRLSAVELALAGIQGQLSQLIKNQNDGQKVVTYSSLTHAQVCQIGLLVREEMFNSIKIIDREVLDAQGEKIVSKCLAAANISEQDKNPGLHAAILRCVRLHLNRHKAHVRKNIRIKAVGT